MGNERRMRKEWKRDQLRFMYRKGEGDGGTADHEIKKVNGK